MAGFLVDALGLLAGFAVGGDMLGGSAGRICAAYVLPRTTRLSYMMFICIVRSSSRYCSTRALVSGVQRYPRAAKVGCLVHVVPALAADQKRAYVQALPAATILGAGPVFLLRGEESCLKIACTSSFADTPTHSQTSQEQQVRHSDLAPAAATFCAFGPVNILAASPIALVCL